MAKSYHITLEVHDEGEWPRITPENLMQHVDVKLPSGLTIAGAKVTEESEGYNPSHFTAATVRAAIAEIIAEGCNCCEEKHPWEFYEDPVSDQVFTKADVAQQRERFIDAVETQMKQLRGRE